MKAKKKAKDLVLRFRQISPTSPYTGVDDGEAKQCALIAVDEVLGYMGADRGTEFWEEVKIEINKL